MIGAFEVGSIFTIEDRATGVLTELATKLERVDALVKSAQENFGLFAESAATVRIVTEGMEGLETSILTITDSLTSLTDVAFAGFRDMTTQVAALTTEMRNLAAAVADVDLAAGAGAMGGAAAAGRGRRGGGHGGFFGGMGKGMGIGGLMTHPATFIAGYTMYKGLEHAAGLEDTIDRAMIAMGMDVGPDYMDTPIAQTLKKNIQDTTTRWGVNLPGAEHAALDATRLLAPLPSDQRMKLLPSVLNFAAAESIGKPGTSMEEATSSGIGLAHQLRLYTPEQIEPVFKAFAQLSMATHDSLSRMSRATSYYVPMLTAGLDMDPAKLMAIGTVGSQMGLNTKSGTWLSSLFRSPYIADLTPKRAESRHGALRELGLMDDDNNVVTKDPVEFLKILSTHMQGLSDKERMKDLQFAFGVEGSRAATLFADPAALENIQKLAEKLNTAPTIDSIEKRLGESPEQKLKRDQQEFNKALTDLGEFGLPIAVNGVHLLAEGIKSLTAAVELWKGRNDPNKPISVFSAQGLKTAAAEGLTQIQEYANAQHAHRVAAESPTTGNMVHISGPVTINTQSTDPNAMLRALIDMGGGTGRGTYQSHYNSLGSP